MRRTLAVLLVAALVPAAALADDADRVVTLPSLDGPLTIVRNTRDRSTALFTDDPALEWRFLRGGQLTTYRNGRAEALTVFHGRFDPWTWLDRWYGLRHDEVEAALADPAAARATAQVPPVDNGAQPPERLDFYGTDITGAAAAAPFRFAYAGALAAGRPLWNVGLDRFDAPGTTTVVAEYVRSHERRGLAIETLPRSWVIDAWPRARRFARVRGVEYRFADGEIYGRSRTGWIVIAGADRLTPAQRSRLLGAIRFR